MFGQLKGILKYMSHYFVGTICMWLLRTRVTDTILKLKVMEDVCCHSIVTAVLYDL
jgi:hypothetical protein